MITTTVGDVIDILVKYDRNTPIVTADPDGKGYNRIIITRSMVYEIMTNLDEAIPVDFIDTLSPNIPESFLAIVL